MHKKNNENQGSENKELFLVLKNIIKENMGILLWVLVVINVILIYKLFVSNVSGEGGVNVFLNDNIAKTLNSEFYNQFNTIMAGIYGYHFNSLTNWLAALGILMTICVFVFGFINYDYMDKIDRIIKPRLDDFDKKIGDEFGNNNKEITDKITANFNEKLAKEMKIKDLLYYIEKLRDGKDELLEKREIYKELIEFEIEDNKEKNWEERVKDAGGGGARDRDFEAGDEWINNIVNSYEYEIAKIYFDLAINEDKDVKKDEQKHKKKDEKKDEIFRGYILDSEKLYKKIIGRFIKNEKFLNDKRNITFINNIYANLVWLYVKKYEKFKDSNDFKSGLDYGYKGIEIVKDYKIVDKKEMNIKACMVAMIIRYLNVREKEYKYDSEYEDYYGEADKLNNEFLKEYFFRNEGYVFKAILLILNFNKLHIEYRKNKEVNKEGFLREQRDIDFFEEAREKIAEINFYYGKYFNMMKEQGENIDVADYKRVSDLYKQMGYLVNHLDIKSFDIKESDKYIEIGIDYFLEAINYRNLGFREYWKNKIDVYLLNERKTDIDEIEIKNERQKDIVEIQNIYGNILGFYDLLDKDKEEVKRKKILFLQEEINKYWKKYELKESQYDLDLCLLVCEFKIIVELDIRALEGKYDKKYVEKMIEVIRHYTNKVAYSKGVEYNTVFVMLNDLFINTINTIMKIYERVNKKESIECLKIIYEELRKVKDKALKFNKLDFMLYQYYAAMEYYYGYTLYLLDKQNRGVYEEKFKRVKEILLEAENLCNRYEYDLLKKEKVIKDIDTMRDTWGKISKDNISKI